MKPCREIENLLYLYGELTDAEKAMADDHLTECDACTRLHESLQATRAFVQRAAQVTIVPQHAGRLTANIMDAVHAQARKKQSGTWLSNLFTKYMMIGTSISLVIFFCTELLMVGENLSKRMPKAKTVTLNSPSFVKAAINRKQKPETKSSIYACIKRGNCDNAILKRLNQTSL